MKVEQNKLKTTGDHRRHAFQALWGLWGPLRDCPSKEAHNCTLGYADRYHQAGWDAAIRAILLTTSCLEDARSRQTAAHKNYWASEQWAYSEGPDRAWTQDICDYWFLNGFNHAIDYIGEMRKRETEEEPLPQFVKELKELLKKWDAEIWAERDECMRLHICYAAKLSDERVIEGSFKRFVNGDDS